MQTVASAIAAILSAIGYTYGVAILLDG